MISADVQSLTPGSRVRLFELDARSIGGDQLFFHGHANDGVITWQGIPYYPWPIEATGFSLTSELPAPTPTLSVGNVSVDQDGKKTVGLITTLCLQLKDLVGATLIVRETFKKYLDAVNFEGGNPSADPTAQYPLKTWMIECKTSEDKEVVTFELRSPIDFQGRMLPGRQIITQCVWLSKGGYRGPYCGYTGSAMFDENDSPTLDPALDVCPGLIASCKKRFGENKVINFGGFPAADRLRGY